MEVYITPSTTTAHIEWEAVPGLNRVILHFATSTGGVRDQPQAYQQVINTPYADIGGMAANTMYFVQIEPLDGSDVEIAGYRSIWTAFTTTA